MTIPAKLPLCSVGLGSQILPQTICLDFTTKDVMLDCTNCQCLCPSSSFEIENNQPVYNGINSYSSYQLTYANSPLWWKSKKVSDTYWMDLNGWLMIATRIVWNKEYYSLCWQTEILANGFSQIKQNTLPLQQNGWTFGVDKLFST